MSLYDFVLGLSPTFLVSHVQGFLDDVMPTVIAVVIAIWAIIGFYYLFKYIYVVIYSIYAHFLRPGLNLKKRFGEYGVITGCTDGIGEAMAFELARKGLNLVLISRDSAKLEKTSMSILKKFPKITIKIIAIDFANFGVDARKRVADVLSCLDVGVLINNVGISYQYPKFFHELDNDRVECLMSVNINSTTWMTRSVLPGMVSRKRGAVVNVSSGAGVTVSPLLAQYGAAKSYVTMFSKALNVELYDFNVHIQVQVPLYVATKLAKISKTSWLVPSPEVYARAAVAAIGYETVTSPYWSHALQLWILSFIPEWKIEAWLVKFINYPIRKAGMRKDAKRVDDNDALQKDKNN